MKSAVRLNRKVVLEEAQLSVDGAGGYDRNWVTVGTLWADIRPGSGRETEAQTLTVSAVPHQIIVRAAPVGSDRRPKPDQRFREGTRLYRIVAVTEYDHAAHYLACHAREETLA